MERRAFHRTIGIDYSGGQTPDTELAELQVYLADGNGPPQIIRPMIRNAPGNWTRRGIAQWLVRELRDSSTPTLVGIDHAFSFPLEYFPHHNLHIAD